MSTQTVSVPLHQPCGCLPLAKPPPPTQRSRFATARRDTQGKKQERNSLLYGMQSLRDGIPCPRPKLVVYRIYIIVIIGIEMKTALTKLLDEFPVIEEKCIQKRVSINKKELITEAEVWLYKQQNEDFLNKNDFFSPHGLTIKLTLDELKYAFAVGTVRTWFNEKVMGWTYRHSGLPSQLAHSIGQAGEIAISKYLQSQNIEFCGVSVMVSSRSEFKQDITISNKSVGIKAATKRSYIQIIRRGISYYPAKMFVGESLRVLPYPELLIQLGVDSSSGKAAVLGCVTREKIMRSPTATIFNKPSHVIPVGSYTSLDDIF